MPDPAIFLSASVPDPNRSPKYFNTADPLAIGAAISGLVYVTLGRRLLVWGGHPAITPMIWATADDMGVDYGAWVHLYQSLLFKDEFPAENARFQNVTYVDAIGNDRNASLLAMRRRMLSDYHYEAGVFVGGMEGVEDEFALFQQLYPNATILPVASTGGAALIVYQHNTGLPNDLLSSLDYVGIIHRELKIRPSEPRQVISSSRP
jgi:SLOG cluster3 family